MHGGGWALGNAGTHDRLVRELAVGVNAAVVFVEYDRSPEARYPVAIEQGYTTTRWIMQQGSAEGLDPSRLAVAGDSVGGNMTAALAILAQRTRASSPRPAYAPPASGPPHGTTITEVRQLYEEFAVPASGKSLWQAALANLNPWTEDKVDTGNPDRGPLLLISGERDHTVPPAIVDASYRQQQDNPGVTEMEKIPGRGHALIIDDGWRDVADRALAFVQRFTKS